ncbi:MAG: TIGR03960 family B12-binding radical SAM protein [Elusimicrobiota bacterium]
MGTDKYPAFLYQTQRPSRYINHEFNSKPIPRDLENRVRVCLCYPDVYEVGASNLGLMILYNILNSREDVYAERVYLPAGDYVQLLKSQGLKLASLETNTELSKFDIIGFTLQYELTYPKVLEILELGGIEVYSNKRESNSPLIIAGGPCATTNPEPTADFVDAYCIGDGEDAVNDIIDCVKSIKNSVAGNGLFDRTAMFSKLAGIGGVYVPALYDVKYSTEGVVEDVVPVNTAVPAVITPRRVSSLDTAAYPAKPIVPFTETVHNRYSVELARGCRWNCAFCQARYIYGDYRERSEEKVLEIASEGLKNTGYNEVSLMSLSSGDYSKIKNVLAGLHAKPEMERVELGLPSLRYDTFTAALAEELVKYPPTTITFAPEVATPRMGRVVNKLFKPDKLDRAIATLYSYGWKKVKLYFMYGLPTETMEDIDNVVSLVNNLSRKYSRMNFSVTLSPFSPKPWAVLQYARQQGKDELLEKRQYLKKCLRAKVSGNFVELAELECVLARGDRKLSAVIYHAWKVLNNTEMYFPENIDQYPAWEAAFSTAGISKDKYLREHSTDERLPWQHVGDVNVVEQLKKGYLRAIDNQAVEVEEEKVTPESVVQEQRQGLRNEVVFIEKPDPIKRVRVRLKRYGCAKYLSHLEQIEAIRRAVKRAGLPVAYTLGYKPHAKISFGTPLTLGCGSNAEYFDLYLTSGMDILRVRENLINCSPSGYAVIDVKDIPFVLPSLESFVNYGLYTTSCSRTVVEGIVEKHRQEYNALNDNNRKFGIEKIEESNSVVQLYTGVGQGFIGTGAVFKEILSYASIAGIEANLVRENLWNMLPGGAKIEP